MAKDLYLAVNISENEIDGEPKIFSNYDAAVKEAVNWEEVDFDCEGTVHIFKAVARIEHAKPVVTKL